MSRAPTPDLPLDLRRRLVELLADRLDFRSESDRWGLYDAAFGGTQVSRTLHRDLKLDGNPAQAAERLVAALHERGCDQGRHALARILEPLEARAGDDRREAIRDLIADLDALCVQPDGPDVCPYLGLDAFSEVDRHWFFGRESFIETLVAAVDAGPVVAVIGPSGSGKSSLVQAGLLPVLRARGDWVIAGVRPGHDPWASLAGCVGELLGVEHTNDLEWAAANKKLGRALAAATARPVDPAALSPTDLVHQILEKHRPARRLLLLIDQFEELYTHDPESDPSNQPADGRPRHQHFAEALLESVAAAPLTLVLTLRADFYHRLLEHRALADAVSGPGHVALSPMDESELKRAIVEPARKVGLAFEAGLPERILEDLGREPGQLPLLEFCLTRLWAHRQQGRLRAAAYHAIGGVRGALVQRAENLAGRLGEARLAQARALFLRLVRVDENAPDTRRRATRDEVGEALWPLAKELADARLLVTGRDAVTGAQVVDVAHEALIRAWPRLREWLHSTRDGLRLRKRVSDESNTWVAEGRPSARLWKHEILDPVRRGLANAGLLVDLERSVDTSDFLTPEADWLVAELSCSATDHQRREDIGRRLCEIGDPRPGVGLHDDGSPKILWCPIPAGKVEISGYGQIEVVPFQMARYPVTHAQYDAFVEAKDGYRSELWWEGLERKPDPGRQLRRHVSYPADNVSWYDATAFCRWLSSRLDREIRLPKESEWQWAAQSAHTGWIYPWGSDWRDAFANTSEAAIGRAVAVGMYPAACSEQGVYDLAGNVQEWCADVYFKEGLVAAGDKRGMRVLRSGSWDDPSHWNQAQFRYVAPSQEYRGGKWMLVSDYSGTRKRKGSNSRPYEYLHLVPDVRDAYLGFRVCCAEASG